MDRGEHGRSPGHRRESNTGSGVACPLDTLNDADRGLELASLPLQAGNHNGPPQDSLYVFEYPCKYLTAL